MKILINTNIPDEIRNQMVEIGSDDSIGLPHQCDSWEIDSLEQLEGIVLSYKTALEFIEKMSTNDNDKEMIAWVEVCRDTVYWRLKYDTANEKIIELRNKYQ